MLLYLQLVLYLEIFEKNRLLILEFRYLRNEPTLIQ